MRESAIIHRKMMRNIGSYFKAVDTDEHRIIEELRSLREKKRKDAHDIYRPARFWISSTQAGTGFCVLGNL